MAQYPDPDVMRPANLLSGDRALSQLFARSRPQAGELGRSTVTIDSERQKESTQDPALTRHKIISHGQDHHDGSG
jgi:hypothetical protein